MAGHNIGEALDLGDDNSVRRTTRLRGKRVDDAHEFSGNEFFAVGPDLADTPKGNRDGICGTGLRSGSGIVGEGGEGSGTGVKGVGGPGGENGGNEEYAGLGVGAEGGDGRQSGTTIDARPGFGVLARGGNHWAYALSSADNNLRQPNGGGIVGISGGTDYIPKWKDSGQVGVLGRGGDELARTIPVEPGGDLGTVVVGAPFPGVGVVGVGGGRQARDGDAPGVVLPGGGAGVVGYAGGGKPFIGEAPRDVGVAGFSNVPESGRAGFFYTRETPQLHLHPVAVPLSQSDQPDAKGMPGDLLVREYEDSDGQGAAELWFCVRENTWRKVAFT